MEVTKPQARRFLLAYQGLLPPRGYRGKSGVEAFIRSVGCIQFDPLNIVGHNSDLVLQARVAGYRPETLRELLYTDRKLVDGMDKMMSIYPAEDWPYFHRWRNASLNGIGRSAEAIQVVLPQVRGAIEARGPLSSLDLELSEIVHWDWSSSRLARAALESLYFRGELVVHHRVHTRKYYDFAHRLLPAELLAAPDPNETDEQYQDWYVRRRIGNVGLLWGRSGEAWLGMPGIKSQERKAALRRLLDRGEISSVAVEGIADPFYCLRRDESRLPYALDLGVSPAQPAVIAPLDNLLWDRRMLKEVFDFDYRWEVYVPPGKRRYGYYVLPILYGDRFIARFEPGFDKKQGVLTVKNWWWEAGILPNKPMKAGLTECFQRFLEYLGAGSLAIDRQAQGKESIKWLATDFS
jgi:uncharacterized protein YcaQ